jgi:sugar transferase (PEP-CTERM/EpsH1 system associated)
MKVVFLTHRLPYAPNRGDRIRAYYLLREMSRFATVSLFSLVHDDDEALHVKAMPFAHDVTTVRVTRFRNLLRGVAYLASSRPLTHCLLDAPDARTALGRLVGNTSPDIVVAYCSGMAPFAFEPSLGQLPFMLDMVDVDSAKWREMATRTHGLRHWVYGREAMTLKAFEARAVRRASMTLVVNERERNALIQIVPDARVRVLQNGIDTDAFRPNTPPAGNPIVIFCGVMNYYPNEEGVLWFGKRVWPLIRAVRRDARFTVVGSGATRAIWNLASSDESIEVLGRVPEVQTHLWRSAVAVAPLRLARGLQNKVLEALAAGLPVVTTPDVLDGLPSEVKPGCVSAESPDDFAQAVLGLLANSPTERRARASAARLEPLKWSERLGPLENILTDALRWPQRPS